MRAIAFDTNASVKKLEKSGLSRTQAEAITEVFQAGDTSSIVTKTDLDDAVHQLELAFAQQSASLTRWFTGALLAQAAVIIAILQYLQ